MSLPSHFVWTAVHTQINPRLPYWTPTQVWKPQFVLQQLLRKQSLFQGSLPLLQKDIAPQRLPPAQPMQSSSNLLLGVVASSSAFVLIATYSTLTRMPSCRACAAHTLVQQPFPEGHFPFSSSLPVLLLSQVAMLSGGTFSHFRAVQEVRCSLPPLCSPNEPCSATQLLIFSGTLQE